MAELSISEKSKKAAELISQIPPGEVNDVINDIRAIVNDDKELMKHAIPALRAYNLAQFHVVEHQAEGEVPAHSSVLSNAAILPESDDERYIDSEGKRSFAFDHVNLVASDYKPYELPSQEEAFRAELARSLRAYCKNHFSTGASSVNCSQHPLLPPSNTAQSTINEPKSTSTPSAAPEPAAEVAAGGLVTDVVQELAGSGKDEPAPTPAISNIDSNVEEVDAPGRLERLDEDLEKTKMDDTEDAETPKATEVGGTPEAAEPVSALDTAPDAGAAGDDDMKAEAAGEAGPIAQAAATVSAVAEKQQTRIENPIYTLEIVGNRYNPNNFWTGRWRTRWTIDHAAAEVKGTINVDVHYYEQGNVQLATSHSASFPLPAESSSQTVASQVVTTISKIETAYHMELNDVYGDLGDKAFRALRRALPVTRQKMDWEKVQGYNLGSDLTKARA